MLSQKSDRCLYAQRFNGFFMQFITLSSWRVYIVYLSAPDLGVATMPMFFFQLLFSCLHAIAWIVFLLLYRCYIPFIISFSLSCWRCGNKTRRYFYYMKSTVTGRLTQLCLSHHYQCGRCGVCGSIPGPVKSDTASPRCDVSSER